MQKPKVLATATALDRFTVKDLSSISGAAENTVRSIVDGLLRNGSLLRAGTRDSKLFGRPAIEYTWTSTGRERCVALLTPSFPLDPNRDVRTGWSHQFSDGAKPGGLDPFESSLALATDFVEILEEGAGPDAQRLLSRAHSELKMLTKWVAGRADDDVTAVAALSLRLDAAREESHLDALRNVMINSQAELLQRLASHEEQAPATIGESQLDNGYGIVLDVSDSENPTTSDISSALAATSRQCFVLKFKDREPSASTQKVLKELSTFLSMPLAAAARIFIVVDAKRASRGRANHIVDWFDTASNLREPFQNALLGTGNATGMLAIEDTAWLLGARTSARARDWLGNGMKRQWAMRLIVSLENDMAAVSGEARSARIALNEPLVIYSDPPAAPMAGDKLDYLNHRTTRSRAEIKGLVMASFPTEHRTPTHWPKGFAAHDDWKPAGYDFSAASFDLGAASPTIQKALPAPYKYGT